MQVHYNRVFVSQRKYYFDFRWTFLKEFIQTRLKLLARKTRDFHAVVEPHSISWILYELMTDVVNASKIQWLQIWAPSTPNCGVLVDFLKFTRSMAALFLYVYDLLRNEPIGYQVIYSLNSPVKISKITAGYYSWQHAAFLHEEMETSFSWITMTTTSCHLR